MSAAPPSAPPAPARRAAVVVFGVLVVATFAAFFIAQRLKNAPSVVQGLKIDTGVHQKGDPPAFSPNGDGRRERARITFRLKKADDVTVHILNADGDQVRKVYDKHLDAYTFVKPSIVWDGRDGRGQLLPDGRYRVAITLAHLGRTVISQRTILLDTTPPKPRVRSIGPSKSYGPELLPEPGGAPAQVHFLPAQRSATAQVFKTAPGTPRLVRTDPIAQGREEWDWDGTNDAGRKVSPGTYLVVLQWRDPAGNRGTSVPLDAKGLPILDRGRLPGHGGVTVRYLGAQTPATAAAAGQKVQVFVDARRARYSWSLHRVGQTAVRAHSTNPKTTENVHFTAPGGTSGSTSSPRTPRRARRAWSCRCSRRSRSPARPPSPRACWWCCPTRPGRARTRATTTATARPTRSTSAAPSGRSGSGRAMACRPTSPAPRRRCCSGSTATTTTTTSRPTWRWPPARARRWPATTAS